MSGSASIQSSSSSTTAVATTSAGGAHLQVTGLASGLDTATIVSQMMEIQRRPVTALQGQQKLLDARNAQLTAIQRQLRKVNEDALGLLDPRIYRGTQKATSSDPMRVAASTTGGAGVGGYQVEVSRLANAAQRTYSFASPTSDATITIDGHDTTLAAGGSVHDLVDAINNDQAATVYAAATDAGTLVLSSRSTGDSGAGFIAVTSGAGTLTEQAARARRGQNAAYSIDGVPGTSTSNVLASALPGVTLTLAGVTSGGAVTVNVSAPAADAAKVGAAVKQFVSDYNAAISAIQTQLSSKPASNDPTQGTLYADRQLKGLLSGMRSLMYQAGSGLPAGLAAMPDIGVSTGAAGAGSGTTASELAGQLTINTGTLETALNGNSVGVQKLIGSWANSMATLVNATSGHGGTIELRQSGESRQVSSLTRRISAMQSALDDREAQLTRQFAAMEAALSSHESTSSWLEGQINQLPGVTRR